MHLLEGVGITLFSVSLYALAYGLHHGAGGPPWAKRQLFASLVGVALVLLCPLGIGFLATGLTEPVSGLGEAALVALGIVPVALFWGVKRRMPAPVSTAR